jgi:two-component system OmpR family response regulator
MASMTQKRIVICDDESGIRQLLKTFLTRHHYEVKECVLGQELIDFLSKNYVNLVILDLMLPDMYGLDVCKKIREFSDVPIIMLTAVQGEMSTVLGFEAGADDYLEKPFSAHVLLSRIRAVLKRVEGSHSVLKVAAHMPLLMPQMRTIPLYRQAMFGQWTFHPVDSTLSHVSGRKIALTRNESTLLSLFLEKQQEVLTRELIAEALRIDVNDLESRAIDVQISRLRQKLRDKSQHNLIQSIRNKGYLLTVPVKFQK